MIKRSPLTEILFKRQRIVKTNLWAIQITSIILIAYLLILAIVIFSKSHDLFEFRYRIDDNCVNYPCDFFMRVDKDIDSEYLYIYIGFDEFYVNHRKVIYSVDYGQLEDTEEDIDKFKDNCKNYYTVDVLREFFPDIVGYEPEGGVIKPCGLYPLLYTRCMLIR